MEWIIVGVGIVVLLILTMVAGLLYLQPPRSYGLPVDRYQDDAYRFEEPAGRVVDSERSSCE